MKNPLPKSSREMIWGSMFGDGGVYYGTGNRHCGYRCSHSPKQREYIEWKYEMLKSVVGSRVYAVTAYHKIRQRTYTTLQFSSKALSYFTRLRKMFYPKGKKRITRSLLNKLTPLGLATWFMDDGTTGVNNRKYPQLLLCTNGFSLKENNLIKDYFREVWEIETRVHGGKSFHIYFNKPNSLKFIEIIKTYIIPSMRYKLRYFLQTNPYPA